MSRKRRLEARRDAMAPRSRRTSRRDRAGASPQQLWIAAVDVYTALVHTLVRALLRRLRRLAEQEGGEAPSAEEKQRMLREARRLLQGLLGKLLDNDDDNDDD